MAFLWSLVFASITGAEGQAVVSQDFLTFIVGIPGFFSCLPGESEYY